MVERSGVYLNPLAVVKILSCPQVLPTGSVQEHALERVRALLVGHEGVGFRQRSHNGFPGVIVGMVAGARGMAWLDEVDLGCSCEVGNHIAEGVLGGNFDIKALASCDGTWHRSD